MQNEWILDVLTDLRTFAHQNGLGALAEHLDDTRLIAAAELALKDRDSSPHECVSAVTLGQASGRAGTRA
jgi:hypothetical protein